MRLQFADCVLDTELRELRRGGEIRPLPPKAFHLLEILVERRPAAVTHADLRKALWPDAVAGGSRWRISAAGTARSSAARGSTDASS